NLLGIVILSQGKCGLSTCTSRYLMAMATADLFVIIIEVILWQIKSYYFPVFFLDLTPVCSVHNVVICVAINCSVWFTVTFSFDRFIAICFQNLKTKYCTKKNAAVILSITCILLCFKNVPFYFAYEPKQVIANVAWFCVLKPDYFIEPGWVGFDWFDRVLTPLLPYALVLLLNALTVRHILVTSRARQRLKGQSKGDNYSDPEMETRRKSVILLFTLSGSFIILWSVYVTDFFYSSIRGTYLSHYNNAELVFAMAGLSLANLNCCINTFVYVATQSKFREQVKEMMKYPTTLIIQLMNKLKN
ncbi:probable G-protein coupled receptor 139, partial [Rhincodon typus]|uniref:probable G-protein coupled receptor 139 n=1 Tax=Rhincodon typus TaxID=259920 RepID=UPI00202DD7BD